MVKVIKIKHAASATTVHETGGTAWLALRLNDRRGKRSGPVKEFVKRYGESFHRPAAGLPAAGAVTWGPGVLRGRVAASHRPGARRPLGPWRRRSPRSPRPPRPRPRPRPLIHLPSAPEEQMERSSSSFRQKGPAALGEFCGCKTHN